MDIQSESESREIDRESRDEDAPSSRSHDNGRDLKITVRKLVVPVRPRGVLAE